MSLQHKYLNLKLTKQLKKEELRQYIEICEKLWGGVPVEVEWAQETKLYKDELTKVCSSKAERFSDTEKAEISKFSTPTS